MNAESNSSNSPPSFNELLDYAEGRLEASEHERIAAFIAEHPRAVEADWTWVQDFLNKTRSVDLHEMPEGLEDRLTRIYNIEPADAPMEKIAGWLEGIRRVVAELVDGGAALGPAAAGLRTKTFESNARQWVFKTDTVDILVNALERPDRRFDLHGQVLPATEEGFGKAISAQLVREDREFGLSTVDAHGEFLIQAVGPGAYSLVIAGEMIEVVCNPITFGA